jgi:hypothetical protein
LNLSRPGWPSGKPADEVRIEVRTLVAIMIMVLMATSSAFARKTSHINFKRAAIYRQSATKPNPGGVERHPDDVALDRKIGSICRGC